MECAGTTVLVVEDEAAIAEAVVTRLRAEGFETATAADGPSAVETALTLRPDLIVLDLNLPGFDGLEVCRAVHQVKRIPVVMLTARTDETDLLVGLGIGADDYLTKPFSMKELVARIRAVLRRTTPDPAPKVGAGPGSEPRSRLGAGEAGSSADRGPMVVAADVHLDPERRSLVWHRR